MTTTATDLALPPVSTVELWRQFSPGLRRYLRRQVRDEALAEDLLQDLFVRVHLHVSRLRAPDRAAPWLFRIARNLVIDHRRKPGGPAVVTSLIAEPASPSEDSPFSPAAILGKWMLSEVARLPPPYRDAVLRVDADGQRTADVARDMGLSTPGIKSRVQRGRARLAQATARCCDVELDRHGQVLDIRRRQPHSTTNCCTDYGNNSGAACSRGESR